MWIERLAARAAEGPVDIVDKPNAASTKLCTASQAFAADLKAFFHITHTPYYNDDG